MTQNSQQYLDFIDMRLNDPELEPWDGRSNRLDPGVYDFEVIKSEMDVSASGKPCMAVTFRVLSEGSVKGRTIRQKYPVDNENDASRRRMKSLIDALQPERDPEGRFAPASLTGLQMHAEVVDNTYTALDGRTGTNVERTSSKIVVLLAIGPLLPDVRVLFRALKMMSVETGFL